MWWLTDHSPTRWRGATDLVILNSHPRITLLFLLPRTIQTLSHFIIVVGEKFAYHAPTD